MIRLQLRLIIAAAFVALLAISTGTALAGPSMEAGSVTVNPTTLTATEGLGTPRYTLVLGSAPTGNVTITASAGTSADLYSVRGFAGVPPVFTFTTTNWNNAQTVFFGITNDTLIEGTETHTITNTITATSDTTNYPTTLTISDVTVTVIDSEADVTLSPTAVAVTEGGTTAEYTVALGTMPAGAVTMTAYARTGLELLVDTDSDTTGDQSDLTFTTTTWNTAQTVTVKAVDDNIDEGATETIFIAHSITVTGDTSNYPVTGLFIDNVMVTVTITDNDTAGVTVSETAVTVSEAAVGTTASYTIKLDSRPQGRVRISVTSGDTGNVTVSPPSLRFEPDEWDTAKTVTVTAVDDDVDDDDNETTITHAVTVGPPFYRNIQSIASVTATATDNDATPGVSVSETAVTTIEGVMQRYTLVLGSAPTGNVTITASVGTSADVTVSQTSLFSTFTTQTSLVFTSTTWNTAQTVFFDITSDDIIEGTETHIITNTITTSADTTNYPTDLSIDSVTVTVIDRDADVTVSPTTLAVTEGGTTAEYTVALGTMPAGEVTMELQFGADVNVDTDSDTTGDQSELTFTTANWNTAQTVTVKAVDDDFDEAETDTRLIYHVITTSGDTSNYPVTGQIIDNVIVTVTVTDDDTAGVSVSETAVTATEDGTTGSYTIKLDTEPRDDRYDDGSVTISVTSQDTGNVTVNSDTLTFTHMTWDTAQTVTVTAVDDHVDDGDIMSAITHAVTPPTANKYPTSLLIASVTATATDNNTAGVIVSETAVTVSEAAVGTTDSYTIKLDSEPTSAVTISVTSTEPDNVTVNSAASATLTFTGGATGNWATEQTVTVTAVDDDVDDDDNETTITHSITSMSVDPKYTTGLTIASVTATATDNDTAGVIIMPTAVTVTEADGANQSADYTVVLDSEPTGNVTITLGGNEQGDFITTKGGSTFNTIVFMPEEWNTAVTVTVTAVDDDIDEVDMEMQTITHAVSGGDYNGVTASPVDVTITDNDTRGLDILQANSPISITEGSTGQYSLRLLSQPTALVTLAISSDSGLLSFTPSGPSFDANTWNDYQVITVRYDNDDIDRDTINEDTVHTATGADYGSVTANGTISLRDNDTSAVNINPTSITVLEEGTPGTIAVKLDTQPTDDVTVTLATTSMEFTLGSDATKTFSTTTWSVAQTVTVTVPHDADAGHEMGEITIAVSSTNDAKYNLVTHAAIDVTINDNDTAGLKVDHSGMPTLYIGENGGTGEIEVGLTTQPVGGNVTVTITSHPPGIVTVDTDPDTDDVQNTLTFDDMDWDTGQFVTLTGIDDDIDNNGSARTTTITIDPSGADYDTGVASSTIEVTLNDEVGEDRGVTLAPGTLTLPSGTVPEDDSRTYTIVLDTEPSEGSVTITPISVDKNVVTVSGPLTFTKSGAGIWSTPQIVTVMGVNNDIDHPVDEMTSISHTVMATNDYMDETLGGVGPVTVTNNDTRGVTVDTDATMMGLQTGDRTIDEGDTPTTYTIVLDTEPTEDVLIHIGILGGATDPNVQFSLPSFTFTPDNWDTALEVTITAPDNDIDHPDNITVTNTHIIEAGGSDYFSESVMIDSFAVTVNDPDDMRGVTLSKMAETILEGDTTTYTIKLNSQPTMGTVTITPRSSTPEVTFTPPMVTFQSADWDTAKEITLRSRADDYDEDNERGTISHTLTGADYESESVTIDDFVLTQTDDDIREVLVPVTMLTILENNSQVYTVVLRSAPQGGSVTITPTSTSIDDVTFMPPTLSFTESDWDVAQSIAVTAEDDDIDEDTYTFGSTDPETGEMWAIDHAVAGADYGANSVMASSVTITVTDDDTRGVTVNPTTPPAISVPEFTTGQDPGDNEREYTVVLDSQPTATVTITIAKGVGDEDTLSVDPATLTFTEGNWADSQSVTITAADDTDHFSGEQAVFAHTIGGGDYSTNMVTASSITATTVDTDVANVIVSAVAVTFDESATAMYTVVLTTDPEDTVLLDADLTQISGDNVQDVTLSASTITFTGGSSGNWNQPQTITVGARVDLDGVGERWRITHRISSNTYDVMGPIGTVTVTVDDPDVQGVTIEGTSFLIEEGEEDTYTIELDTEPVGRDCRVTVTVEYLDTGDLTAIPSLMFSALNWDRPQTVTLTPVDDYIDEDAIESVTLTHRVAATNCVDYGSVTADTVSVDIEDNDERGVIVSETTREITEETTSTYTVVLNSQPTGDVTVDLNVVLPSAATATVSPSTSRLTFNAGNWSNEQTVTLGVPHDPDVDDGTARIEHIVDGADYATETATNVSVTIKDDDMEGVTITPAKLRFVEGRTAVYEVVLDTQPSVGQVVKITITDDSAQVRVDPAELTFTRATWDDAQRVTVQSLTDADELNDIVNITHKVENYGDHMEEAAPVEATVAEFELAVLAELGRPAELTATARTGKITLRWKSPVPNDDGRVPTSYEYRYTPTVLADYESPHSSGAGWIRAGGSTARFVQISGLINLAEYTFQVRGVDAILLSEADSDEDLSTLIEVQETYIHRTKSCP